MCFVPEGFTCMLFICAGIIFGFGEAQSQVQFSWLQLKTKFGIFLKLRTKQVKQNPKTRLLGQYVFNK